MTLSQYLINADACPQFLVSKIVKSPKGHINKIPCNPQGITADHKDPINWMSLAQTEVAIAKLGPDYRVGLSITEPIFFLDIDKALINGEWSQLAKDLCQEFDGCFIEVSQSGTGLHIIGRYTGKVIHRNKNTTLGIELYTRDRFVMLGNIHPKGDWNKDATAALNNVIDKYFSPISNTQALIEDSQNILEPLTDDQVLAKARAYKSAKATFGGAATFDDLYEANEEVLARAYPTRTEGKVYDASGADQALANMLVIYTEDKQQIVRLMEGSKLAREKWFQNEAYLPATVHNAITSRQTYLSQHGHHTKSQEISQEATLEMPKEFDGCYYVIAEREIYTPHSGLLNQDGFNICFGGPYIVETPYKTFKRYAAMCGRIVDRLSFKPDLKPGEITVREDLTSINTYKPISIARIYGDMEPFFRFFHKMIPDERDQRILLSYAAVLAQKPGIKSQWCVVLQGVQGCGKSLFADFVAFACGETYTHRAKGDEFENRFNSQWFGKTLILIEDPQFQKGKLEEALKPLITSKLLAFEGKGKNIQMNDFPANFILTLNDFDLIQKREETRRLAVFMSALQTPEDLVKAGMIPAVFRQIINWRDNGGYEIFANFILNYVPDPEFDFSGDCVTAPITSTTQQAIEASRPEVERLILEEIAQERMGFRGGWISSTVLTDFLIQRKVAYLLPNRKRGDVLQGLGYIHHPALYDGRAVRNVLPDNKRSRLFIKRNHPDLKIVDHEAIMKAYELAQK